MIHLSDHPPEPELGHWPRTTSWVWVSRHPGIYLVDCKHGEESQGILWRGETGTQIQIALPPWFVPESERLKKKNQCFWWLDTHCFKSWLGRPAQRALPAAASPRHQRGIIENSKEGAAKHRPKPRNSVKDPHILGSMNGAGWSYLLIWAVRANISM